MLAGKLLSFNIFGKHCQDLPVFEEKLGKYTPDVICLQELGKTDTQGPLGTYNYIDSAGYGGEIVGVFTSSNTNSGSIKKITKISTSGKKLKVADRHAIIFTYQGMRVANLHLEGGRYSDQTLFTQFTRLLAYKQELLKKVIGTRPDIILGDFNSVYNSNPSILAKYLSGQYKYFQNNVLRQPQELTAEQKEMVNKWNAAPYELLKGAGYVYSQPDNESHAITNGRGQSIIDTIWYNPQTVKCSHSHILTNIIRPGDDYSTGQCISDHNPVYAEFQCVNSRKSGSLKRTTNHRISHGTSNKRQNRYKQPKNK